MHVQCTQIRPKLTRSLSRSCYSAKYEANNRKLLEVKRKEKKETQNILCCMHFYANYKDRNRSFYLNWLLVIWKKNTMNCYTEIRSIEHLYFSAKNFVSCWKNTFYFTFKFAQKPTMQIYLKLLLIVSQNTPWINHFKFNGELMWRKPRRDLNEDTLPMQSFLSKFTFSIE